LTRDKSSLLFLFSCNDVLLNNSGNWILLIGFVDFFMDCLLKISLVIDFFWLDDDSELIWFDSLNISLSSTFFADWLWLVDDVAWFDLFPTWFRLFSLDLTNSSTGTKTAFSW